MQVALTSAYIDAYVDVRPRSVDDVKGRGHQITTTIRNPEPYLELSDHSNEPGSKVQIKNLATVVSESDVAADAKDADFIDVPTATPMVTNNNIKRYLSIAEIGRVDTTQRNRNRLSYVV